MQIHSDKKTWDVQNVSAWEKNGACLEALRWEKRGVRERTERTGVPGERLAGTQLTGRTRTEPALKVKGMMQAENLLRFLSQLINQQVVSCVFQLYSQECEIEIYVALGGESHVLLTFQDSLDIRTRFSTRTQMPTHDPFLLSVAPDIRACCWIWLYIWMTITAAILLLLQSWGKHTKMKEREQPNEPNQSLSLSPPSLPLSLSLSTSVSSPLIRRCEGYLGWKQNGIYNHIVPCIMSMHFLKCWMANVVQLLIRINL